MANETDHAKHEAARVVAQTLAGLETDDAMEAVGTGFSAALLSQGHGDLALIHEVRRLADALDLFASDLEDRHALAHVIVCRECGASLLGAFSAHEEGCPVAVDPEAEEEGGE